jgi:hypothetical protein
MGAYTWLSLCAIRWEGGTLGFAAPEFAREDSSGLVVAGYVSFDMADMILTM